MQVGGLVPFDRGDVDDRPAGAVSAHRARSGMGQPVHCGQVDVDHLGPVVVAHLGEVDERLDACVVDQPVEAAMVFESGIDDALRAVGLSQVGMH